LLKRKVVLLGDSKVGKTSLIRRFVIDEFHDHYIETIGTKVSRKDIELEVNGKEFSLNLQIWDVLGQKAYSAVHTRALLGMNGALLVADLTRKETLDSIENHWLPTLSKVVLEPHLVFLANKMDLMEEAQFTLDEIGITSLNFPSSDADNVFMTSAKTGKNVEKAFLTLARMMVTFEEPEDPTKEIFEDLIAESAYMDRDKTSLKGITDIIIAEFCREYEEEDRGMSVLRELFVKAGVDVSNPTKVGMFRIIDYLAEEESKFIDAETVRQNKEKRLRMIKGVRDVE
jgi:small GTP-binding protein